MSSAKFQYNLGTRTLKIAAQLLHARDLSSVRTDSAPTVSSSPAPADVPYDAPQPPTLTTDSPLETTEPDGTAEFRGADDIDPGEMVGTCFATLDNGMINITSIDRSTGTAHYTTSNGTGSMPVSEAFPLYNQWFYSD